MEKRKLELPTEYVNELIKSIPASAKDDNPILWKARELLAQWSHYSALNDNLNGFLKDVESSSANEQNQELIETTVKSFYDNVITDNREFACYDWLKLFTFVWSCAILPSEAAELTEKWLVPISRVYAVEL